MARIHEILIGHRPMPRHVKRPAQNGVEECDRRVGGPLRERHVRREHAGQIRYVRRIVRVALPLRHPRIGRERQ